VSEDDVPENAQNGSEAGVQVVTARLRERAEYRRPVVCSESSLLVSRGSLEGREDLRGEAPSIVQKCRE
jgi:hypothetical protein